MPPSPHPVDERTSRERVTVVAFLAAQIRRAHLIVEQRFDTERMARAHNWEKCDCGGSRTIDGHRISWRKDLRNA
jgi:hypothetical protein